jgi:hypothetical protein
MNGSELREYASDAIRYWEPRRIVYNGFLTTIVVFYHFKYSRIPIFGYPFDGYLFLVLLAVLGKRRLLRRLPSGHVRPSLRLSECVAD